MAIDAKRWLKLLMKAVLAVVLASACAVVPLTDMAPGWLLPIQLPVASFLLICYIGKLLYDTLFFDHFRP